MKKVDLMKDIINMSYIHTLYMDVDQPMVIYDSRGEFTEAMKDKKDKVKIVGSYGTLVDWAMQFDIPFSDWGGWDITKETGKLLFINTKEKFIPAKINKYGTIVYKVDSKGEMIPTDGCFVRVYKLIKNAWRFTLFTATGVWDISQNRFAISAGVKAQYRNPTAFSSSPYYGLTSEEKVKKLMERKRPTTRDYRLFNYLFNPQSSMYVFGHENPMKAIIEAVKLAYGSIVRQKDAPKMVFNERFSKVFLKEVSRIMPGFKTILKEQFDGKTVAEMLNKTFNKSMDDGTVDDARNVIKDILTLAHGDELMGHESDVPLIGDESIPKQISDKVVEPFELTAKQASNVPVPKETAEKALKPIDSELGEKLETSLSKEKIEELRKETDSIGEYVDAEDFIKNTFDED